MGQMGGARPGAGRKPGKMGAAKLEISLMAREHAEAALLVLVEIAQRGESEAARVSAANALLDRGYGKPPQAIIGDPDNPLVIRDETARDVIAERIAGIASRRSESGSISGPH